MAEWTKERHKAMQRFVDNAFPRPEVPRDTLSDMLAHIEALEAERCMPIGVNYRDGQPVCVGDKFRFDPSEWGDDKTNVGTVCIANGVIEHIGSASDFPSWCDLIERGAPAAHERKPATQ